MSDLTSNSHDFVIWQSIIMSIISLPYWAFLAWMNCDELKRLNILTRVTIPVCLISLALLALFSNAYTGSAFWWRVGVHIPLPFMLLVMIANQSGVVKPKATKWVLLGMAIALIAAAILSSLAVFA